MFTTESKLGFVAVSGDLASEERAKNLSPPPTLKAEGLYKRYPGKATPAVSNVGFALRAGEGLALLGENGSGKTSLLALLAGTAKPSAGQVQILGFRAEDPQARRALGFVPQELALYEELSGLENVMFFGRVVGLRGDALAKGCARALEAAALWDVRNAAVSSYSGGMRRRLSVACALVHAPRLLLLDEPFSGIDEDSRTRLLTALVAEKERGAAIVITTHHQEDVAALCERSLTLQAGSLVRETSHRAALPSDERAPLGAPRRPR